MGFVPISATVPVLALHGPFYEADFRAAPLRSTFPRNFVVVVEKKKTKQLFMVYLDSWSRQG